MTGPHIDNRGVFISGGQVSAGQIVAGHQASAARCGESGATAVEQAVRQLSDFLALVERHRERLADADATRRDVDQVQADIASGSPNRGRIMAALGRITAQVAAVGALAAAADHLQNSVLELLA